MNMPFDPEKDKRKFKPNIYSPNTEPSIPERLALLASATGTIESGKKRMIVGPEGTTTNFPTSRDQPVMPQQPVIVPVNILATQPVPMQPTPTQPAPIDHAEITHLTTNAELAEMAAPRTKLEPMTAFSLGVAARSGDPKAQATLLKHGITATSAELTNEPAAITQMKAQIAARPGGKQILKPAERRVEEQETARRLAVLTQERDLKYAVEKAKYDEDLRRTELGLKKAALEAAPAIAAERELNIMRKKMELQGIPEKEIERKLDILNKNLDAAKKQQDIALNKDFEDALRSRAIPTEQSIKAMETVDRIQAAQSPEDIQSTYSDIKRALQGYGVDQKTINDITLASMNASYVNPGELIADKGVEVPPLFEVNSKNQELIRGDINDALASQVTPDQAVDDILRFHDINVNDPENKQFVYDTAVGVWNAYDKMGIEAQKNVQEKIATVKAQNTAQIAPLIAQMTPPLATSEGVQQFASVLVKSTEKDLQLAEQFALRGASKIKVDAFRDAIQRRLGVSQDMLAGTTTPDNIANAIFDYQIRRNGGTPLATALTEQKKLYNDGKAIDPTIRQLLDIAVFEYGKGVKSLNEETAQKRKAITDAAKDQEIRFEPGTDKVAITVPKNPEGLELIARWDKAKSSVEQDTIKKEIEYAAERNYKSANVAGEYKNILEHNEGWKSTIEESGIHNQIVQLETQKAGMTASELTKKSGIAKSAILDKNIETLKNQLTYRRGQYIPERAMDEMSPLEKMATLEDMKLAILGDARMTPDDKRKLRATLSVKIKEANKELYLSEKKNEASTMTAEQLKAIWNKAMEPIPSGTEVTKPTVSKPETTKPENKEIKRRTKDGKTGIFDASTKKFIRWE